MNLEQNKIAAANAFNQSNAAYKKGEWEKALACANDATTHHAELMPACLMKARCLVQLGQWMPAREAFAQTLRLEPNNFSAWLEAGHLCKQMGEVQQAAAAYERAMAAAPQRHEAHLAMARVMAQQGQPEMAHRAYNDAVQAATAKGAEVVRQVHWMMGQYVLELGHAQEALGCFDQALKVATAETPEALTNMAAEIQIDAAMAWLRLDNREKAMRMLTLASAATQEATLSRLAAHTRAIEQAIFKASEIK
jgi:protein O-GlcNAc transferase